MSLDVLWFVVVALFWSGFFVLEGFDFGVGVLHHAVGRTDLERRARVDTPRWRGTWSWTLTVGSALVPLLLGVALGDLLTGLPIAASNEFTGSFLDLLTPYGLWLGLTLLVLCLLHGATFLGLKTGGVVRERSRRLAGRLVWPSLPLVLVYAVWTVSISDGGPWRVLAVAVPAVAAVAAALQIRAGRDGASFTATAVAIGGTVAALFANLYPDVMVSSTTSANNLTVAGTASGDYALKVMTVVAAVMFPVVLLYQGWSYWVFRARLNTPAEHVDGTVRTRHP